MSTTLHRNPPFRAEHLGSLLRPKDLLDKKAEVQEGKAQVADLKPLEDAAIKDIVAKQQEWGYRALSDGEYRYARRPNQFIGPQILDFERGRAWKLRFDGSLIMVAVGTCSGAPFSPVWRA